MVEIPERVMYWSADGTVVEEDDERVSPTHPVSDWDILIDIWCRKCGWTSKTHRMTWRQGSRAHCYACNADDRTIEELPLGVKR